MDLEERFRSFMDANKAPFPEEQDVFERMVKWLILTEGDLSMCDQALRDIWKILPSTFGDPLITNIRAKIFNALPGLVYDQT